MHLQKNTPLSQGTIKNLKNLGRHLKDYEWYKKHQLDFDSIDMKFYNDFTFFLTKKKQLSINTIGKLITNLKVVMREALEEGYTTNTIFTHRKFRSSSVETETVYLSENEIDEIRNLDLNNNKRLDKIRDLFIIGCYTGLRYSDLAKLSIDKIYDDILEVAQTKTGDRVHIPLREEVKQLIEKYNGNFPKTVSNQKFNEYLKEVCALCPSLLKKVTISKFTGGKKINATKPKFEFIKSHTARRSFATNEFLSHDLQTAEIRAITGHKSDKSFYKYIRVTPRENAENVAKKWAERKLRKIGSPNAGNLRAVS
ncbi:MAG: site-specific integrase [Chitinophagaceae bacterium]